MQVHSNPTLPWRSGCLPRRLPTQSTSPSKITLPEPRWIMSASQPSAPSMVVKRAVPHRRSRTVHHAHAHEDSTHVDAAPPACLSSSRVSSYFKALGAAWAPSPYSVWTHIYGRVVLGGCFVALGIAWWLITAPAAKTTAKPRDIISYIPLEDDTQITPELVDRLNNLIQFRQPDDSDLTPHDVMKNRVRDLQYMFEGLEQMVEPSQWERPSPRT